MDKINKESRPVVLMVLMVIILLWADEILDLPHLLLGAPETPVNWRESILETLMVCAAGVIAVWMITRNAMGRRKAVDARRKIQAELSRIVDGCSVPIFVVDRDHRVTHWNRACEGLTGLLAGDVIGTKKQWSAFYSHERPILADLLIDGATPEVLSEHYGNKWNKSQVIQGAYEAEDFFPDFGPEGKRVFLTAAPLRDAGKLFGVIETLQDITGRKRAEEKADHLNLVLRTVRSVNQLITKEKDRDRLIRRTCEILVKSRGYFTAWIALLDESGRPAAFAEAGLGKDFEALTERLKSGELVSCARAALERSDVVVVEDPLYSCGDCPLVDAQKRDHGKFTARLNHEGKTFGFLCASVPAGFLESEEERTLFEEVAGDIAFALHGLEEEKGRKRAEEALRKEKDRAQMYLDIAGVILLALDKDENVILVNKKGCKVLEGREEEILGKNWFDNFLPKEQRKDVKGVFAQLMAGNIEPVEYNENPVITKSGKERIIAWHNTLLKDKDGHIIGTLSSGEDITERRQAEEALRESEKKFREIFDTSADAILIFNTDGFIVSANPMANAIYGYGDGEMAGLSGKDIVRPDYYHLFEDFQKQLEKTGLFKAESVDVRKDGTFFNIEVRGSSFIYKGKPHLLAMVRDVTDRKRAEEALRESEEHYRSLVEISQEPIAVFQDGKLVFVNAAFRRLMAAEKKADLVDLPLESIIHSEHLEMVRGYARRRLAGKTAPEQYEMKVTRLDGEVLWVEISATVRTYDGRPATQVSYHDITERKRAQEEKDRLEQQLRHQQKLESIGTLASGVAHEINNPLTGVLNYAELIRDRAEEGSQFARYAKEIMTGSERMATIVKNLLAFARQEKERHSPANIADIVEATLSLIRAVLRKDQISVVVDVPKDLPRIKCRSGQLQQVVMNLLTNARDALNLRYPEFSDGKTLKITSSLFEKDGASWIRTTVEDYGMGISPDVLTRVFDPFFTTKPRDVGTGLGLSVSHGIVKDHNGELYAESEEGEFARFFMDLPVESDWSLGKE